MHIYKFRIFFITQTINLRSPRHLSDMPEERYVMSERSLGVIGTWRHRYRVKAPRRMWSPFLMETDYRYCHGGSREKSNITQQIYYYSDYNNIYISICLWGICIRLCVGKSKTYWSFLSYRNSIELEHKIQEINSPDVE